MAMYGNVWQCMARYGKVWQGMARYGKVWQGMVTSDRNGWRGEGRGDDEDELCNTVSRTHTPESDGSGLQFIHATRMGLSMHI